MKTTRFAIIFMFTILLSGCENAFDWECDQFEKSDGLITYSYPSGSPSVVFEIKNCSYDGIFISFFEDGGVKKIGQHEKGRNIGIWYEYNSNQILQRSGHYDSIDGNLNKLYFYSYYCDETIDTVTFTKSVNSELNISNSYKSMQLNKITSLNYIEFERVNDNILIFYPNNFSVIKIDSSLKIEFNALDHLDEDTTIKNDGWNIEMKDNRLEVRYFKDEEKVSKKVEIHTLKP